MGDFNNDGNFDLGDARYGADGLFSRGRSGNTLDRAANFTEVDNASTSGNLFGTTLATGKAYAAGDSRGDIAGSGVVSAGANPNGADGIVNAADIDAVYANFKGLDRDGTGAVEWINLTEVAAATLVTGQRVDLSADMNDDLAIGQADVDNVVRGVLGTNYGDANLDGTVSAADISILSGNFRSSGGWAAASFDGDGEVTATDLSILSGNFGFRAGAPGGGGLAGRRAGGGGDPGRGGPRSTPGRSRPFPGRTPWPSSCSSAH